MALKTVAPSEAPAIEQEAWRGWAWLDATEGPLKLTWDTLKLTQGTAVGSDLVQVSLECLPVLQTNQAAQL